MESNAIFEGKVFKAVCAGVHSRGNLLIAEVAGVGEGLQLHSRLRHLTASLGLDDGAVNVLLQVDEASAVAHRHPRVDVRLLGEERLPHSVGAHDVVHVHADGVADSGRQGGGGGGGRPGGATRPRCVSTFGKVEDNTWERDSLYLGPPAAPEIKKKNFKDSTKS